MIFVVLSVFRITRTIEINDRNDPYIDKANPYSAKKDKKSKILPLSKQRRE